MSHPNTKVNISVPSEMLDRITKYMNILAVADRSSQGTSTNVDEQENIKNEVLRVCGHRMNADNEWEFKLTWRQGGSSWVNDADCNCEFLINKYLATMNINTNYLVCRVSTKEQTSDTHTSLEAQEQEILSHMSENDKRGRRTKVVKISASAYKSIPKELEIIAEACSMFDSIYIYRVDRLSRNIVKYLEWLEYFEGMGVSVIAVSENMTYKDDKLKFIRAVVAAQEESELIGKRVKMSYRHRINRGDTHIGALPYGKKYKVIREKGQIVRKVVVDNEPEILIIKTIKNSRKDIKTLMHELNAQGVKKRGRKWTLRMVYNVRKS